MFIRVPVYFEDGDELVPGYANIRVDQIVSYSSTLEDEGGEYCSVRLSTGAIFNVYWNEQHLTSRLSRYSLLDQNYYSNN